MHLVCTDLQSFHHRAVDAVVESLHAGCVISCCDGHKVGRHLDLGQIEQTIITDLQRKLGNFRDLQTSDLQVWLVLWMTEEWQKNILVRKQVCREREQVHA